MALAPTVFRSWSLALLTAALCQGVFADEAAIRKNIAERVPNFPAIDDVSKTPIAGLYEIRTGTDVFYTDELGHHIIEGQLIDTATRTNLTEARIAKLTAIDFATLPMKDAIVWKTGTGARKIAVFADPNCGYCKKFEREVQQLKDVTIYTFLLPILGPDSTEKANNIWCAKDSTKAWRDWMLNGTIPVRSMGQCDTAALQRNTAMGRKYKVNGTPALVFENGRRVPGAMSIEEIEKQFVASRKAD